MPAFPGNKNHSFINSCLVRVIAHLRVIVRYINALIIIIIIIIVSLDFISTLHGLCDTIKSLKSALFHAK